jgi:5-carboxymethyl-2-hydroxymuconate isomerase
MRYVLRSDRSLFADEGAGRERERMQALGAALFMIVRAKTGVEEFDGEGWL